MAAQAPTTHRIQHTSSPSPPWLSSLPRRASLAPSSHRTQSLRGKEQGHGGGRSILRRQAVSMLRESPRMNISGRCGHHGAPSPHWSLPARPTHIGCRECAKWWHPKTSGFTRPTGSPLQSGGVKIPPCGIHRVHRGRPPAHQHLLRHDSLAIPRSRWRCALCKI